jgi:YD repeat-containing protein
VKPQLDGEMLRLNASPVNSALTNFSLLITLLVKQVREKFMRQCAFTRLVGSLKMADGRLSAQWLLFLLALSPALVYAQAGIANIVIRTDARVYYSGDYALPQNVKCASAQQCGSSAEANLNAQYQAAGGAYAGCTISFYNYKPDTTNTVNGRPYAVNVDYDFTCVNADGVPSTSTAINGWWATAAADCPTDETGIPWTSVTVSGFPHYVSYCQKTIYQPQQPPPNVCPKPEAGNPLGIASGEKLERNSDYRDANGLLEFERSQSTSGGPWGGTGSIGGSLSSNHSATLVDLRSQNSGRTCYPSYYQETDSATSRLLGINVYRQVPYCFPYYQSTNPAGPPVYVWISNSQRLMFDSALGSADNLGTLSSTGTGVNVTYALKRNSFQGVEQFDTNGLLKQRIRSDGKSFTYTYDTVTDAGSLTRYPLKSITDNFGRKLSLNIDSASNQITKLTDPAGQIYNYVYGEASANCLSPGGCSRLTSVVYPDLTKKIYHYDEPAYLSGDTRTLGRLTGVTDEKGSRYSTFSYGTDGRVISTQHAGGVERYDVAYTGSQVITSSSITDPLGSVRTMGFTTNAMTSYVASQSQPAGSGCAASSSAIAYDTNANPISRDNFTGQRTCYAYDLTRNLETVRAEGLSNAVACPITLSTYVPPASTTTSAIRKVSTQWHPDWRMETRRAEPKLISTFIYNGQPDPTAANATASCAPTTALLPDGKPIAVLCKKVEQATTDETGGAGFSAVSLAAASGGTPRVWTYTYNAFGQVLTAKGPRTDVNETTTNTYYATTTVDYTMGDLATMTNAAGHVTNYTKYDPHGNVLRKVEPNGMSTDYTYDLRQRLKTVTVTPSGGATAAVPAQLTKYDYDPVGQMIKATQPDGSFITYTYDPAHRLTDITDSLGNTMHYTLDNMGNRVKEETKDAGGALKRNIARVYDALNRLQNVTGSVQ